MSSPRPDRETPLTKWHNLLPVIFNHQLSPCPTPPPSGGAAEHQPSRGLSGTTGGAVRLFGWAVTKVLIISGAQTVSLCAWRFDCGLAVVPWHAVADLLKWMLPDLHDLLMLPPCGRLSLSKMIIYLFFLPLWRVVIVKNVNNVKKACFHMLMTCHCNCDD